MNFDITELDSFGLLIKPNHAESKLSELNIVVLRELLQRHQLLVLRQFQTLKTAEEFSDYCAQWGEISVWPFGKVLELVEKKNPTDHIFDHSYVPLHWDGMYRPQVPELQIFHCVSAPREGQGGRTTFSNTAKAIKNAPAHLLDFWSRVTGNYQRKMEFYHSHAVAPIVTKHPTKGFSIIRYCEPARDEDKTFINPPILEFTGVDKSEVADFHMSLRKALYASENFYAHQWQTGDVVISDNYTLLHGREAFSSGAPRHLRRVHVLGNTPLNNPHLVFHA